MADTLNFFQAQDDARGRTTKLVALLFGSVILVTLAPYVAGMVVWIRFARAPVSWYQPEFLLYSTITMLVVILIGSSSARAKLAKGGSATACQLGAKLVSAQRPTDTEKVFLNVVQEMALAASLPVPSCYVFSDDTGINAFAAGNHPKDAAIALTQGALKHLNREELQGVVAFAMSHIGNADMNLCIRFIGVAGGLNQVGVFGQGVIVSAGATALTSPVVAFKAALEDLRALPFIPFIIIFILIFAFLLLIVGVFLLLLGGVGLGLTHAIQAAVWSQRESLGDASAVQFTRYPAGLASALKKVTVFGSAIKSAARLGPEWDVLFFASSRGDSAHLTSLRSSIAGRINLIDPDFDGLLPVGAPVAGGGGLVANTQLQAVFASGGTLPLNLRIAASEPVGAPVAGGGGLVANTQLQAVFGSGGTLPLNLRIAASEPVGAMGIVLGLILRQDPALRTQQLAQAQGLAGGEVVKEALKLEAMLRALPAGHRVPLLDVAMPALRQLSAAQVAEFGQAIDQVGCQADDGLLVLLIHASMRRYLSAVPRRVGKAGDYVASCALILSAVVQTSGEGTDAQAAAYLKGAKVLGMRHLSLVMIPPEQVDLAEVESALGVIADKSVIDLVRRQLVNACCVAMLSDGKAEPAEIEIIRAVADTLGVSLTAA